MVSIKIDFSKKDLWIITAIIIFVGIGIVFAYNENWVQGPGDPKVLGHSPDEVSGSFGNPDWRSGWFDVSVGDSYNQYTLDHNLKTREYYAIVVYRKSENSHHEIATNFGKDSGAIINFMRPNKITINTGNAGVNGMGGTGTGVIQKSGQWNVYIWKLKP